VGEGFFGSGFGDEAEVGGARCGMRGFGIEGVACLVQVDLLLAEVERPAAVFFLGSEVECAGVEVDGGGEVSDGEDEMIEAQDPHADEMRMVGAVLEGTGVASAFVAGGKSCDQVWVQVQAATGTRIALGVTTKRKARPVELGMREPAS
jgi:hypothetical protein